DQGNLRRQFDVLVFVGGAIPSATGQTGGSGGGGGGTRPALAEDVPAEYRDRLGRVTAEKTIPQLAAFLEAGGTIITIGSSANLARHLALPVEDHLVERQPSGTIRPLPPEKFYIPASLLEVAVDNTRPVSWGMEETAIVMFNQSPVFRLPPDAVKRGVRPVAWYANDKPLRSGWAWGQTYLENGIAAVEAKMGTGTLHLLGPEITFRAQPHGTFKLLFNGIANAGMQAPSPSSGVTNGAR
ncbi:MAG: peptidase, partial [Gemmatimonadales bacterium]